MLEEREQKHSLTLVQKVAHNIEKYKIFFLKYVSVTFMCERKL